MTKKIILKKLQKLVKKSSEQTKGMRNLTPPVVPNMKLSQRGCVRYTRRRNEHTLQVVNEINLPAFNIYMTGHH